MGPTANDCPLGVGGFVVVVVVVCVCFWHSCVFWHRWVVRNYMKCLATSGFIFPISIHTE